MHKVWEAEREKEDAVRLATELPEPDAVTFYKEALEFSDNTSTVKPFTKEFPSLGTFTFLMSVLEYSVFFHVIYQCT